MERIRELLSQLQTLDDAQIKELTDLVNAHFDELSADETPATAEMVAEMGEMLEAAKAIKAEQTARVQAAAELKAKQDEAKAAMDELRAPEKDAEGDETPEPEDPDKAKEDEETPPPAETGTEVPAGDTPAEGADNPLVPAGAGVQASAPPRGTPGPGGMIPAMAQAQGRAEPSPEGQPRTHGVTIVAAAGIPTVTPGDPFADSSALAEAMSEKLMRLQTSHDFSAALVASARWDYPEDRQLGDNAAENTRKLDAVVGMGAARYDRNGALVATGGICAPTNVDYSVPTWSSADRPLRDGLPSFQATRGGIRFVQPPDIGVAGLQGTASGAGLSTGIWSQATDASPAGATKPVWTVACGSEIQVFVNAIPTRVQFGNMESRFAPEQVAANTQQAIAISAREAELELLTLMANSTKQINPQQFLGGARDVLTTVDLTKAQYLYSHRYDPKTALTAVFPAWAKDMFRADLAREQAHDNSGSVNVLAITDAQIEEWFSVRGISNVIWTMDGLKAGTYGTGGSAITNQFFPIATAGAQPQWPGQSADGAFQLVWFLFVEGTFQFLDGGRLDLGVVRDSLLDATNDYETFVEVFESVAFRGNEAYQVQSLVKPNGGSAATGGTYHE